MAAIIEKPHVPSPENIAVPSIDHADKNPRIAIVFTSFKETAAALKRTEGLARSLRARTELIVTQVVPYPLPLVRPPVPLRFYRRRLGALAEKNAMGMSVRMFLCRDPLATLTSVLKPHSLVIIGGRKRWWALREKWLARALRRAGFSVIFTETE